MSKLYPVEVEWEDSCSQGGWSKDHAKYTPAECRSIGYLLHRDKEKVVLAQSEDGLGKQNDSIVIPASCVKKLRRLYKKGKR